MWQEMASSQSQKKAHLFPKVRLIVLDCRSYPTDNTLTKTNKRRDIHIYKHTHTLTRARTHRRQAAFVRSPGSRAKPAARSRREGLVAAGPRRRAAGEVMRSRGFACDGGKSGTPTSCLVHHRYHNLPGYHHPHYFAQYYGRERRRGREGERGSRENENPKMHRPKFARENDDRCIHKHPPYGFAQQRLACMKMRQRRGRGAESRAGGRKEVGVGKGWVLAHRNYYRQKEIGCWLKDLHAGRRMWM